jgi:lysine 6-dehydrogenase
VLGGGRVGSLMARDLKMDKDIDVTVVDVRKETLAYLKKQFSLKGLQADLSDQKAVGKLVKHYDLVIGAVPGFMGYQTLKTVIEAGVDICDISFMPEDFMKLDALAKKNGVTAITDCGVAPGISNMTVGYCDSLLDKTTKVLILVGGLPKVRTWPYEYKAVFSPIDVIEEYTRPARFIRDGKLVTMPALTEPELIDLPGVGTVEAFNTDGLRSIMDHIKAPDMIERTLRYPGHIEKMRMLRETGFFSQEPIDVKGVKVRPLDLTTKLLFPMWEMKGGMEDITVMRIVVEGKKGKKDIRYTYDLLDHYDHNMGATSMSRTTGYPNAIMARMVLSEKFKRPGVCAPEFIGQEHEVFETVLKELAKRNVNVIRKIEEI